MIHGFAGAFTKAITLSDRRLDLLAALQLKGIEKRFFAGITSNTRRFGHYAIGNWAFAKAEGGDPELAAKTIEWVVHLVSNEHHATPPRPAGIQHQVEPLRQLSTQWNDKSAVRAFITKRTTYGGQYYRGPLTQVGALTFDSRGRRTNTAAGLELAQKFEASRPGLRVPDPYAQRVTELASDASLCLCCVRATHTEKWAWQHVFLGFLKSGDDTSIDWARATEFREGRLSFKEWQEEAWDALVGQELSDYDESDEEGSDDESDDIPLLRAEHSLRGASLALLLVLADQSSIPAGPDDARGQHLRDAIQFRAIAQGNSWLPVSWGALEPTRDAWAVYVHNLYSIGLVEGVFADIAARARAFPAGATKDELTPVLDEDAVEQSLVRLGLTVRADATLAQLSQALATGAPPEEPTLERNLLIRISSGDRTERWVAAAILMTRQARTREAFGTRQQRLLTLSGRNARRVDPASAWAKLKGCTVAEAATVIAADVLVQHQFAAAKKFRERGTRAWILIEEDGIYRLMDPTKTVPFEPYRENRARNALEILSDLELLRLNNGAYTTTEEGRQWIQNLK